ncbi:MAG TPA: hypothetical protein VMS54_07875 [Vicinamibacterales bacterium]|nr:hypothetical protein [Vicinamibacterales bacterium]
MTRFIGSLAVALALVALPMAGRAEQAAAPAQPKPKTLNAMGTVSAVAMDSLTVKSKTESWTFTIDKDTSVNAKGATHKTLELKKEGKASKLTEFVKVGDAVTVSYHDLGATKHASLIRVTSSMK